MLAPSSGSRCNVDSQLSHSILLVDDDENSCELLRSMLVMKFPHAKFYCAGDGKAGLEACRRYLPDIVITDINMPGMDGVQMLANLSVIKPDVCVIVVTAHSDRQNIDRIISTGLPVELVSKPVDFKILFASIKRCIASLSSGQQKVQQM